MSRLLKAFGAGARGVAAGVAGALSPGQYIAAGVPVHCQHCGSSVFELRHALLNTAGLSFFNLDWANKQATVLVCDNCGLAHWFAKAPERAD